MIKDFTGKYPEMVAELKKLLGELGKLDIPPIEIRDNPREVYSPEEIAEIKKDNPDYDPDTSDGEFSGGVLRLFSRAFDPPFEVADRSMRAKGIFLHELGHSIFEKLRERNLFNIKEWDRIREADGEKDISGYVGKLKEAFGFYHDRTREDDFADSFRWFVLLPEKFSEYFPNRFAFCQKLISSKAKSLDPS